METRQQEKQYSKTLRTWMQIFRKRFMKISWRLVRDCYSVNDFSDLISERVNLSFWAVDEEIKVEEIEIQIFWTSLDDESGVMIFERLEN